MKKNSFSEAIVSESGVELIVSYTITEDYSQEECHGVHMIDNSSVELDWVEMIIDDKAVEFTRNSKKTTNMVHFLTDDQQKSIIDQLSIW